MSTVASPRIGTTGCPYPGLRRFDESNAHLYFGREREIGEVVDRLSASRFLAITGESGCGKSSLIRAGVIPAVHRDAAREWIISILQPGDDPVGRLAQAMEGALGSADPAARGLMEAALRASSSGLIEAARQWRLAAASPLLIVVDQFEEIFRFKQSTERTRGAEDARAFVRLLLTATAGAPNLYVILTMRSDYLGECAQFTGLPEAINRGEYLLSRPTRDELRRAIVQPAEVTGARIAPRLAAQLLNEVGDDPGELPVLQHALMRTWQEWNRSHAPGEAIDLDHYRRAGTLHAALSQHADEVYRELKDPALQSAAGRVFRALTETPPGGRPVRRPSSMARLERITGCPAGSIETVVQRFAEAGFLVTNGIVDLTHESLITRWPRLVEWTADEAREAQLYRALARDAAAHARNERGLWRSPELGIAQKWRDEEKPTEEWAKRIDPDFTAAMEFLESSEREERRRRYVRWGLLGAGVLAALAVVGALGLAQRSRANAEAARAETERVKRQAAVSEQERLQRRLQELTIENPQLSEEAVKLRTEVRAMEWEIVRLAQESQRLEWEIAQLGNEKKDLDARAANLEKNIASTVELYTKIAAEIDSLTAEGKRLDAEQQSVRARYNELRKANAALREAAVKRGMLAEEPVTGEMNQLRDQVAALRPTTLTEQQVSSVAEQKVDSLQFKLQQLERENLALKRSVEELRQYHAQLTVDEAKERTRNDQAHNERKRMGEIVNTASDRVHVLDTRLATESRTLAQRTAERNRLLAANGATREAIVWLQGANSSLAEENAAIEQWLKESRK